MTTPIVVAFTGKRGSGKSEAARVLVEKLGFRELKFADQLKNMLRAMYQTCGVDVNTVERKIEGDLKEVPCEWLMGKTPRYAMQTLGTEWRNMINTQLWSEMFRKAVLSGNLGDRIVCSDYRFEHEGVILDELGAVKYRIVRPTADAVSDKASQHASETELDNIPTDFDIINDRSIGDLQVSVLELVMDGMKISGINVFPTRYPEGGCMSKPLDEDWFKHNHQTVRID